MCLSSHCAVQHNVKTSFDPTLSQYTTQLDKTDTPEFRQREARAARTAELIERGSHAHRLDDTEMTEEEKFSSVPRVAGLAAGGKESPLSVPGAKACSDIEAEATAAAAAAVAPASSAAGSADSSAAKHEELAELKDFSAKFLVRNF